jgi:ribonuclease PH
LSRLDGRANDELRAVQIVPGFMEFAEGSTLIKVGRTSVVCTATVDERVPTFLRGQERGWVTAEYAMLPRATSVRTPRRGLAGQIDGRSQEIQRLIGRSLRAVTDLSRLGERTIILDCDVLQADGGTRSAAITGAYVALWQALDGLIRNRVLSSLPLEGAVAAVSVGVVDGEALLDLSYEEDSRAQVDFNVVMTGEGEIVEVQGAAEGAPFSRKTMEDLVTLAETGIARLLSAQAAAMSASREES